VTPDRLRELEWNATYLKLHPMPPRCRCAGTCESCKTWHMARRKALTPEVVLELVEALKMAWEDMTA
jgi:hypothetical protein